jgi:glycosidase
MSIPDWIYDAIFYQIFPDRFANGDPSNDPVNVQPWGADPTEFHFQGGDLRGVIHHFDYLLDLGVNAIYFNPIFSATSNHRYNTSDYYRIDPKLGVIGDFCELLELAHSHNMRVILDGVFNHCGRGFFAFHDLMENEEQSTFRDWFHVLKFPLHAYGPGKAKNFLAWWDIKSLPKFNTDHPDVRRYLLGVAKYWIEQGVDGWRLDVPNEIDDDSFWAELRRAVKEANPDAYLVGEIWEPNPRWVGESHFDGLMNYPLRTLLGKFIVQGSLTASGFSAGLQELWDVYPPKHNFAHFLSLGSHDTERLRRFCKGDPAKARLFFLFQFTYPGVPHIYYGDEIGMDGGKDPACRGAFPWDQGQWDTTLRNYVKKLIRLRRNLPQLRRGEVELGILEANDQVFVFKRTFQNQHALILMNVAQTSQRLEVPTEGIGWGEGLSVEEKLRNEQLVVQEGKLTLNLPALGGALLVPNP